MACARWNTEFRWPGPRRYYWRRVTTQLWYDLLNPADGWQRRVDSVHGPRYVATIQALVMCGLVGYDPAHCTIAIQQRPPRFAVARAPGWPHQGPPAGRS